MKRITAKLTPVVAIAFFSILVPHPMRGQAVVVPSGTANGSSGNFVSDAKVAIGDIDTGQSRRAQTISAGGCTESNLVRSLYTVAVSGEGQDAQTSNVTLTNGNVAHTDLALNADPRQQQTNPNQLPPAPQSNPQASPAGNANTPSLQDLGFGASQTQGSAKEQALLNKRTHMLKVHQTLGLITAIPMVATLITGPQVKAKGKNGEPITEPTDANLDFHMALGSLTTGLYFTTAYYAIFAPKIPGVKPRGAIRLHRDLVWVHAPGMIITPVLGIMAYKQENAGEKVHGIASAHGAVAYITAAAYGASIVAVSWPIHWKFWER